jgi:hypothetical protein
MSYGVDICGSSYDFAYGLISNFTTFNDEVLLNKIMELSFPDSTGIPNSTEISVAGFFRQPENIIISFLFKNKTALLQTQTD